MKPIVFINSHPIQYFAPLYKYMNEHDLQTNVWYCSNNTNNETLDREFGVRFKWDIPLLEGYKYSFYKNYSWKPSHANGFFGLMNLGMVFSLFRQPKSIIIIHGWHYFTHLTLLMLGRIAGHTVCLRCEVPYNQEQLKTGWKQKLKGFGLRYLLFPRIDSFLYIGTQNKRFYESYGIKANQLVFAPYCVDNDRFRGEHDQLIEKREVLRAAQGIAKEDRVILYAGKYSKKKKPLEVLEAYRQLAQPNYWLIMVGEGNLRTVMESFIAQHCLNRVRLTGFVNQTKISEYYEISDLFVMYSGPGETWGLSVNEAMNFNLPVVLSDITGCALDLVEEGANGYIVSSDSVPELVSRIEAAINYDQLTFTPDSAAIVSTYSFATITQNIINAFGKNDC